MTFSRMWELNSLRNQMKTNHIMSDKLKHFSIYSLQKSSRNIQSIIGKWLQYSQEEIRHKSAKEGNSLLERNLEIMFHSLRHKS